MTILSVPSQKYTAAAALFLASSEVLAGPAVGAMMHAPPSTAVPMLGGAGLIVLSALLAIVSLRFLKERHRGGGHFLVLAAVVGALAAGGSGLKLISDANARGGVPFTNPNGASVPIPYPGCNTATNLTGIDQGITGIFADPGYEWIMGGCSLSIPDNAGNAGIELVINGGGSFLGPCSVGMVMGDKDYCDVLICAANGGNGATNAGGCGPTGL